MYLLNKQDVTLALAWGRPYVMSCCHSTKGVTPELYPPLSCNSGSLPTIYLPPIVGIQLSCCTFIMLPHNLIELTPDRGAKPAKAPRQYVHR